MSIDFKGSHYPKDVILYAVFFYVRYAVSYRGLEEIMAERRVQIDHATLNRWVLKYSPDIAKTARIRKHPTAGSWRMDKLISKLKRNGPTSTEPLINTPLVHCCAIPCRAVGKTLDFMLSKRRDKATARRFFKRAIKANGVPHRIVIDKSGENLAGLLWINVGLKFSRPHHRIEILRVKYLNSIVEQAHHFIKKITKPVMGFKAFHSATATLAGIEVAHMIRKKQFQSNHASPFKTFASLALKYKLLYQILT